MVSRLTEEFQAEGFYGQDWFKLFGSLHQSSDLMLKLITLKVQERSLVIAIYPGMLWGCLLCACGSGMGEGNCLLFFSAVEL